MTNDLTTLKTFANFYFFPVHTCEDDDLKCIVENKDVTEGDLDWAHIRQILRNDYW